MLAARASLLVGADEDVGGLHVAVHEAVGVGVLQRPSDVAPDLELPRRVHLRVVAGDEGASLDVLQRQVRLAVDLPRIVHKDDVRVHHLRKGTGLDVESFDRASGQEGRGGAEDLEGDGAAQFLVLRLEDGPHAARAQLAGNEVLPEPLPLDGGRPGVGHADQAGDLFLGDPLLREEGLGVARPGVGLRDLPEPLRESLLVDDAAAARQLPELADHGLVVGLGGVHVGSCDRGEV